MLKHTQSDQKENNHTVVIAVCYMAQVQTLNPEPTATWPRSKPSTLSPLQHGPGPNPKPNTARCRVGF
jgi:hypothetical protein